MASSLGQSSLATGQLFEGIATKRHKEHSRREDILPRMDADDLLQWPAILNGSKATFRMARHPEWEQSDLSDGPPS
jgi:hypothetical protein